MKSFILIIMGMLFACLIILLILSLYSFFQWGNVFHWSAIYKHKERVKSSFTKLILKDNLSLTKRERRKLYRLEDIVDIYVETIRFQYGLDDKEIPNIKDILSNTEIVTFFSIPNIKKMIINLKYHSNDEEKPFYFEIDNQKYPTNEFSWLLRKQIGATSHMKVRIGKPSKYHISTKSARYLGLDYDGDAFMYDSIPLSSVMTLNRGGEFQ